MDKKTATMQGIKNIVFDLGGVIIALNKKRALETFRKAGVTNIDDYLGEYRQEGVFLGLEDGSVSRQEFYEEVNKITGKNISPEALDAGWMNFLDGIAPYKFDMLLELKKKYNTYLLSNTNPIVMKWAQSQDFSPQKLPLNAFFHKCYLSYEVGYTKPDEQIFHHVINDAGIRPEETLFLDDGEENIEMAKSLGFKVYLANQEEDLRKVFND